MLHLRREREKEKKSAVDFFMIQYCIFFIQQTKSTKKDTCMFSYMYNNNTKGIEIKLNIVCIYASSYLLVYTYTRKKNEPETKQTKRAK